LKAALSQPFLSEDASLRFYLNDIARYTPLTAAQECATAIRIRNGDKLALETLVKANLRFVVSVARNYQNQGMSLSDLINEGNLGLIRAAKRFDHTKNFKFISYAVWWIRQAMLQALANQSRIVRLPLNRAATMYKMAKARATLEQKYQRAPSNTELGEYLDTSEKDITHCARIAGRAASLDAPIPNRGNATPIDLVAYDPQSETPENNLMRVSRRRALEQVLHLLTEREQAVIRGYFGIDEDTAHTLDDIGVRLGITRERVRQIKNTALDKLRRSAKVNHVLWKNCIRTEKAI